MKALQAVYRYLRAPEASTEWPSAVSRLVDAQDRTRAASGGLRRQGGGHRRVHD